MEQTIGNEADLHEELARLRQEVQALALANVHAAELMAQLSEARELEEILRANNAQLQKAKLAEEDRSHFLELVARNQPVDSLLHALEDFLEHQHPGMACSFLLAPQGELKHSHSSHLPPHLMRALGTAEFHLTPGFREALNSRAPFQIIRPGQFDRNEFCKLAATSGYQAYYCWPAVNNSGRMLGLIVAFSTEAREVPPDLREHLNQATALFALGVDHRLTAERIAFQAHHDALTGLANRTYFYELLQDALNATKLNQKKVAVLWADLDRFKQINDTLGHQSADLLLQVISQRLKRVVGSRGVLARMGADEFVVMLRDIDEIENATELADRMLRAFRDPFGFGEHEIPIHLSIGVSVYPDHADDAETLVRNADLATYSAKCLGRNTFVCFTPESQGSKRESYQLEFHLRRALELNQLELFFQPLVACSDGSIECLETLLRWYSPQLGSVSPAQFIPVAEASGLMLEIGQWVLERACQCAADWQGMRPGVRVAVNVSPTQLVRGDFPDQVRAALDKAGLDPGLLELELTESAIIGIADYQRYIEGIRALGVSLAIDDFGTGYSSLSYLHTLKVDTLKMDRSFVQALGKEPVSARLAETIIALAKNLGLRIVAEGIETIEQMNWLTDLKCDLLQGYLIHKPMTLEAVRGILQSRHPVFVDAA